MGREKRDVGVNWKLSAIVAVLCLVISLVVGALARNGFWSVVLRALFMAVLGGGLAMALRWAALRFLPELSESAEEGPQADIGRSVDIVVRDASDSGDAPGLEEVSAVDPLDEAVAARVPSHSIRPSDAVGASTPESGDDEFAQEVEELRSQEILPAGSSAANLAYEPVKAPSILDDVDVLPDLDGFQDAFAVALPGDGSPAATETETPSFSRRPAKGGGLGADDPSTLAKAIRTVLSKEKKG